MHDTGDWRQEAGDRRQDTRDRRQVAAERRPEKGDRRQETGDRRQEAGDRRQETGDKTQEASPEPGGQVAQGDLHLVPGVPCIHLYSSTAQVLLYSVISKYNPLHSCTPQHLLHSSSLPIIMGSTRKVLVSFLMLIQKHLVTGDRWRQVVGET